MRQTFPLFQSHIDLAHSYWKELLRKEDIAIDATCGNGRDTLFLARCLPAHLHAIDIQKEAIANTETLLRSELEERRLAHITLHHRCHSSFPEEIKDNSVTLIVYNLGYMPSGDKTKTTVTETTLKSVQEGMLILKNGGVISITCYPGHQEGDQEEKTLLWFCRALDPSQWSCCHHQWLNRKKSPSLLFLQKGLN